MASNDEVLLQCCKCRKGLDMELKALTCLHVKRVDEVQVQTSRNRQHPQCHEIVKIDQLTLLLILVHSLKCHAISSHLICAQFSPSVT